MKKVLAAFLVILLICIGLYISRLSMTGLTNKSDIIKLFHQHQDSLTTAVEEENFDEIKNINRIRSIDKADGYIDFFCGGKGFGSGTHYYGFFYSQNDDLTAWNGGVCSVDELSAFGNGYRYQQPNGDNEYYVEKIGEHFFYYKAHF